MKTTQTLSLLALLALGACTTDDKSVIVIEGRAAPTVSETGCTFNDTGPFEAAPGLLDVSPGHPLRYRAGLRVTNWLNVPQNGALPSAKSWRAEAARIRVNPPEYVNKFRPNPPLLPVVPDPEPYVTPLTGQEIETRGTGVILTQLVEADLGAAIQAAAVADGAGGSHQVVLGVSLQGHSLDGEFVESEEWFYPLDICIGCLTPAAAACAAPLVPERALSCFEEGQDQGYACVVP